MDIEHANEALLKKMVDIVNRKNQYLFNAKPKQSMTVPGSAAQSNVAVQSNFAGAASPAE